MTRFRPAQGMLTSFCRVYHSSPQDSAPKRGRLAIAHLSTVLDMPCKGALIAAYR